MKNYAISLQATLRGMEECVHKLPGNTNYVLIDGNQVPPNLGAPAEAIVKVS